MKKLFVILSLSTLIMAAAFLLKLAVFIGKPAGNRDVSLRIEKGEPLHDIVGRLKKEGVITNELLLKVTILLTRSSVAIRAGDFVFPAGIKPREVLALLRKGDFRPVRVTIPEGWASREIAAHLGRLGLVNPDVFLQKCGDSQWIQSLGLSVNHLEGYLYPDTYNLFPPEIFPNRDQEERVLRRLVERFKDVYAKNFEGRTLEAGLTREQVVTLASIIEKETAREEERSVIASVFFNRLRKGMPLSTDPTLIYGIANFSGNLTRKDLERPGPYNTYLNKGLPPTPISNPGFSAIRAVLYPAATDYLFFVSKNDGTHQFSKAEGEHSAAVQQYQRSGQ